MVRFWCKRSLWMLMVWAAMTTLMRGSETLVIKGSDTLGGQLIPRLAEEFQRTQPGTRFEIASEGSSTGILAVLEGGADLAMTSRPLSQREEAMAQETGMDLESVPVALDAIVVIVHETNPMRSFSLHQVEQLFCGDFRNWVSVGGPAGPVFLYTRHTASGTYSRFQQLAMRSRDYSGFAQKMAGNEQIAMEVSHNPLGIGYVSRQQAGSRGVQVCRIDGVEPSMQELMAGRYPLVRELGLILERESDNARLREFVNYCRSEVARKIILSSGFVPHEQAQK